LQPCQLRLEVSPLANAADSPIEHEQSSIGFAHQALNFGARHPGFLSDPHGMDLALFDPLAHCERV
jgi:hypothetical protein